MITVRILTYLKWLALAGIVATTLTENAPLGIISSLTLLVAQVLMFLRIWMATARIVHDSETQNLPEGIRAEAVTVRRLVLPRAYPVLLLSAILLALHITSPTPRLANWSIPGFAIGTTLAGVYCAFAEFFALRLLEALQLRVAAMLAVHPRVNAANP